MLTIGLTGGIASGKTTVAGMLQKKGAMLLDADLIAREIVKPGAEAWREIVDWLGPAVLTPEGAIDRRYLGELVFNDPASRERINRITHPRIVQELFARAEKIKKENSGPALVLEIPLLIELNLQSGVDLVLLVYVSPEIQLERLQKRDRLTPRQARNRLKAQMPLGDKKKYAQYIIDNSGLEEETARQVELFWKRMIKDG